MRFTLVPSRWHAMEIIGDDFGLALRQYSSIRVDAIRPTHTGQRVFELQFYHPDHPEGVRTKHYTLHVPERGERFLLAKSTHHNHVLWRGMYGKEYETGLADFVERPPTLAPALADFVRLLRFYLASLTCRTRLRERIDAALAHHLSRQPGLVRACQDVGVRYSPRRAGEEPVDVLCRSSTMLLGLPARLEAQLSPGASSFAPTSEGIPVFYALLGTVTP